MDRGRAPNGIGHLIILLLNHYVTVNSQWLSDKNIRINSRRFEYVL